MSSVIDSAETQPSGTTSEFNSEAIVEDVDENDNAESAESATVEDVDENDNAESATVEDVDEGVSCAEDELPPLEELKPRRMMDILREGKGHLRQAFGTHLETWTGARMAPHRKTGLTTRELELRRFLMLHLADGEPSEVISRINEASTKSGLDGVYSKRRNSPLSQLLAYFSGHEQTAEKLLVASENVFGRVYEDAMRRDEVVELPDAGVFRVPASASHGLAGQRIITEDAREEMHARGIKTLVLKNEKLDMYYQNRLALMKVAQELLNEGMPLDELVAGVNEQSSDETQKFARSAITAVATSLVECQRADNFLMRSDGDAHSLFSLSFEEAHAVWSKDMYELRKIGELKCLDLTAIGSQIKMNESEFHMMLSTSSTLDTLVFTSKLFALLYRGPLPRTIEYSRVLMFYSTILRILTHANPLANSKKVNKTRAKAMARLKAVKGVKVNPKLPQYARREVTHKDAANVFNNFRATALAEFLGTIGQAFSHYESEQRYHCGEMHELARQMTTPQFSSEIFAVDPFCNAKVYYQKFWVAINTYNIHSIRAYELAILYHLNEFIPREQFDDLCTKTLHVDERRAHPYSMFQAVRTNTFLDERRDFPDVCIDAFLKANKGGNLAPAPPLGDSFDLNQLVGARPAGSPETFSLRTSPTISYDQLQRHHRTIQIFSQKNQKAVKQHILPLLVDAESEAQAAIRAESDEATKAASFDKYERMTAFHAEFGV